jgi:hypothetical protein
VDVDAIHSPDQGYFTLVKRPFGGREGVFVVDVVTAEIMGQQIDNTVVLRAPQVKDGFGRRVVADSVGPAGQLRKVR